MKRREIIRNLSVLPFAGSLIPYASAAAPFNESKLAAPGFSPDKPNIYQTIGVEPVINCRGTFTIIGGSVERPEVVAAMKAASGFFVQYDELAYGIGRRLAEITGAEWGMVSAGCAAGLKHVTAACVTGGNPEKLIRIPDLTGFEKTEVIIPGYSRNVYDHAVRNIGVTVVNVDTPEEFKQAFSPRTALIYLMACEECRAGQPLSLEAVAEMAKPHNIPILVDAAAEVLTIPNVHLNRGATIVAYSGGKAICGPQCAGLLLGSKSLLMSAWQASSPHHGPGRDNKVGKEEMMGMLAAVEAWVTRDHQAEWKTWLSYLDYISKQVIKIAGVSTSVFEPTDLSNRSPVLTISWDPNQFNITGDEVAEDFARNKPRIAIGSSSAEGKTSVDITTGQMQPGNDKIVAERIVEILTRKRERKPDTLAPPAASISGHWDVTVEFFSGTSLHKLSIVQDGNWIQGTHTSDYSSQELVGTIEGNNVKLRSDLRRPGDNVTYLFNGTLSGETIGGSIYLGEYMTANFSARRTAFKKGRKRIVIPGGPPLAT